MYLFDTNICVYSMRGKIPELTERIFRTDPADISISAITVFELAYGSAKSSFPRQTAEKTNIFLAPFTILPFEQKDAEIAGELRAYLTKAGLMIGAYDLLIAAQGLARGLTVVTHNTKEFSRVPGIILEDWMVDFIR